MAQPFTNIERDTSLRAWEVSIGVDDSEHDAFQIWFFDDGRTEFKRYTATKLRETFTVAFKDAIEEAAPRLKA